MKRFLPLVFALCACGDDVVGPPTPVDMSYRVIVTELENDCGTMTPPEGATAYVDARLWPDGTVELYSWSSWIPGPGSFPEVDVRSGEIDYHATRYSSIAERSFPFHIHGVLTMEAMALEVDARWYRFNADLSKSVCTNRVRLEGPARGYRDRESLDGRWPLTTEYMGSYCEGDPQPNVPIQSQVLMLETNPQPDELLMNIEDVLYLGGPLPDAGDFLWWEGTFYLRDVEGIDEVQGTLIGTFRPDTVLLDLEFTTLHLADGCRERYRLSGHKRTASRYEVDNEYRAVYRVTDGCSATSYAEYGLLEIVEQSETEVAVRDEYGTWFVDRQGATLHEVDGSAEEGVIGTFDGTAAPPHLNYSLVFWFDDGAAGCTIGHEVDAVVRYYPELEWDPAFLPDPMEEASDGMRSLRMSQGEARSGQGPMRSLRLPELHRAPGTLGPLRAP